MDVKQLKEKYKDAPPDSILERGVEIVVKVRPPVSDTFMILEDDSGCIEALGKKDTRKVLKLKSELGEKIKLKGMLVKSPFEDICFEIDEVLEQNL